VGTLNRRIVELEAALQAVQKEYGEAQRGLTLAREVGWVGLDVSSHAGPNLTRCFFFDLPALISRSEESVKRALDMQKELEQLKEERNNLYRLQATNAQRVVELSDAKKGLEAELAGKVAEWVIGAIQVRGHGETPDHEFLIVEHPQMHNPPILRSITPI
jgi:hypothetical protein